MIEQRLESADGKQVRAPGRIAREARRRLKLVASRIPSARDILGTQKMEPAERDLDRVVVISDTHFGDPMDTLTSPEVIDRLMEGISGLGKIDELVLLGDLFDFWKSPVDEAVERGRQFVASLYRLSNVGRIVYVLGNHDHHIFRMYYGEQVIKNLRAGSLEQPELVMPLTDDCPVMKLLEPEDARAPMFTTYPMYQVKVRGKTALMTHGHLLGFFERSLWHAKTSVLATLIVKKTETLGLEEMEAFLSPMYELIALSAFVPGITSGSYRVYRFLSRTGRALGLQGADRSSAYRNTPIEESAAAIEALLEHFCEEKPAYFVYGHSHLAGKLALPLSGTVAVNTGCWIEGDLDERSKYVVLEITDDARLLRMDSGGGRAEGPALAQSLEIER